MIDWPTARWLNGYRNEFVNSFIDHLLQNFVQKSSRCCSSHVDQNKFKVPYLRVVFFSLGVQFFQLSPWPLVPCPVSIRHLEFEGRTFCLDNACVWNHPQDSPALSLTPLILGLPNRNNFQPSCGHSSCLRLCRNEQLLKPFQQPE